jgi:hypothetical protein
MSDVEPRIESWRNTLEDSDRLGPAEVRELESHLREEMGHLQAAGLSDEEAFLVARHRLGETEALAAEYAKVNPGRRSLLRLSWMAAGVLVYLLAGYLAIGISAGGIAAAVLLGAGGAGVTSLALVGVAAKAIVAAALLGIVWACLRRWSWSRLTGRLRTMSRFWLVLVIGGLIVVDVAVIGFQSLFRLAALRGLNSEEYGRMALVTSVADLGWALVAPVLAALLMIALRTRADRYRPATP